MMGQQPKMLLSDEEPAIEAGLKLLYSEGKWNGIHCHDSFHVLRNIKKKLAEKSFLHFFSKLISARNKTVFSRYLRLAKRELSTSHRDIEVLSKFEQKK